MVSLVGPTRVLGGNQVLPGFCPTRVYFLLPGFLVGRRPTPDCPTRVFEKLQKVLPEFSGKSRSYQGFLLPGFQNPKNYPDEDTGSLEETVAP